MCDCGSELIPVCRYCNKDKGERVSIKERITRELEVIQREIDSDSDQERATLEGWEEALKWVLNEIEKEGESNE